MTAGGRELCNHHGGVYACVCGSHIAYRYVYYAPFVVKIIGVNGASGPSSGWWVMKKENALGLVETE